MYYPHFYGVLYLSFSLAVNARYKQSQIPYIYYNIIIYTIYIRLKLYKLEVSTRMRIRYALIHTRVLRTIGIFYDLNGGEKEC